MRSFYSPAERRLLAALNEAERAVVEALMNELDARLVEDDSDVEEQTSLFDKRRAA